MNMLIGFCILSISLLLIYIFTRNKDSLETSILFTILNTITFILSFKYTTISTFPVNTNSITFVSMLSVLYIYYERNNIKETRKLINQTFVINIGACLLLLLSSFYTQTIDDTIGINMKNLFIDNYRILITYPIVFLLSNYGIIYIYKKIKDIYDNMFISTSVSFLLIGLIELIVFTLCSYLMKFDMRTIVRLILSTYMLRILLTILYSFFLTFIIKKKKVKK